MHASFLEGVTPLEQTYVGLVDGNLALDCEGVEVLRTAAIAPGGFGALARMLKHSGVWNQLPRRLFAQCHKGFSLRPGH